MSIEVGGRILLDLEEYNRLRNIESQYEDLKEEHGKLKKNVPKKVESFAEKSVEKEKSVERSPDRSLEEKKEDKEQFGEGVVKPQSGDQFENTESSPKTNEIEPQDNTVIKQDTNTSRPLVFRDIKLLQRYKKLAQVLFKKILNSETIHWNSTTGTVSLQDSETNMKIQDLLPLTFYTTTKYDKSNKVILKWILCLVDLGLGNFVKNSQLLTDFECWFYVGKPQQNVPEGN